jgi:hypothetical protein
MFETDEGILRPDTPPEFLSCDSLSGTFEQRG